MLGKILVFGKNKELGKLIIARGLELGYSISNSLKSSLDNGLKDIQDIYLQANNGMWTWSSRENYKQYKVGQCVSENEYIADLHAFFNTDVYAVYKPVKVKLNDGYTAEVTPTEVRVGCQTFSVEKLREALATADRFGK